MTLNNEERTSILSNQKKSEFQLASNQFHYIPQSISNQSIDNYVFSNNFKTITSSAPLPLEHLNIKKLKLFNRHWNYYNYVQLDREKQRSGRSLHSFDQSCLNYKSSNHFGNKLCTDSKLSIGSNLFINKPKIKQKNEPPFPLCNHVFYSNFLYSHHFRDVKLPIIFDRKQIKSTKSNFFLAESDKNFRNHFDSREMFLNKYQCIECRFKLKGQRGKISSSVSSFPILRKSELKNIYKNSKNFIFLEIPFSEPLFCLTALKFI